MRERATARAAFAGLACVGVACCMPDSSPIVIQSYPSYLGDAGSAPGAGAAAALVGRPPHDFTVDDADATTTGANSDDATAPADVNVDGIASDASLEAGTDTIVILAHQSRPSADGGNPCLACAGAAGCLDAKLLCEHLDSASALDPASDASPVDSCRRTLSCVLGKHCTISTASVEACYCGSAGEGDCIDAGPSGDVPCLTQEQQGLGTTDTTQALQTLTDTTLPAGTANALVQCLIENGCNDCLF